MIYTRQDYQETFFCSACHRPIIIRIPAELRADFLAKLAKLS